MKLNTSVKKTKKKAGKKVSGYRRVDVIKDKAEFVQWFCSSYMDKSYAELTLTSLYDNTIHFATGLDEDSKQDFLAQLNKIIFHLEDFADAIANHNGEEFLESF